MGRNQHSFTPEKKEQLVRDIVEHRLQGQSFGWIATKLKCAQSTAEKYFNEVMRESQLIDPAMLVAEYCGMTKRLLDKALKDHYLNKVSIKDVEIALNLATRFNGVNIHLESVTPERLPDVLTIEVRSIPFEKPPDASSSDIPTD